MALNREIAPNLPLVFADARKLERVWVNLLDNALCFTPESGSITVSAAVNGDALLFAVRDTGIGIAPSDFELIFQKFGHVAPAAIAAGKVAAGEASQRVSSGLGLTFCRLIVEAHGGTLPRWRKGIQGLTRSLSCQARTQSI